MVWHRIIYFVGAMTVAYIISELSLSASKKLEQSGKFKFLIKLLILIHYFSAICSLFIGLIMHYQKENTDYLQKRVDELTKLQQDYEKNSDALINENKQLQNQLNREALRANERSFESGRTQGYVNGYSVGFEDCMDILDLEQERKLTMLSMARKSGIHRIKTRPTIFVDQKAVEDNGILK